MSKYKNVLLIFVALILFVYAGLISIYPSFKSKHFDINEFEKKALPATGLNVTFNYIDIKVKPNFTTIITLRDLDVQYPDKQPLLKAKVVELTTSVSALLFKNFDIKSLYLKNVQYDDQILPSKENKLAYFPEAFDPKYFGSKKITIKPGPVSIKDLNISYTQTEPYSYKTEELREANYTKEEVKEFLSSYNFKNIEIK